jgi:hypothetical protein
MRDEQFIMQGLTLACAELIENPRALDATFPPRRHAHGHAQRVRERPPTRRRAAIMIVGGELVLPDVVAWVDEKDASAAWARARIQHGIVDA